MVGPDYKQPEVPLADHYITDTQPSAARATSVGHLDGWWEGLADPLWSRLVTAAMQQNLSAKAPRPVSFRSVGQGVQHLHCFLRIIFPYEDMIVEIGRDHIAADPCLAQGSRERRSQPDCIEG